MCVPQSRPFFLHVYITANHFVVVYVATNHFYQVPRSPVISKVARMVDLDKSRKRMGWNGQDSLQCNLTLLNELLLLLFFSCFKLWFTQVVIKILQICKNLQFPSYVFHMSISIIVHFISMDFHLCNIYVDCTCACKLNSS